MAAVVRRQRLTLLISTVSLLVATVLLWLLGPRRLRRPGPLRRLILVADRRDIRRVSALLRRGRPVPEDDRPTAQAVVDVQASMSDAASGSYPAVHRQW